MAMDILMRPDMRLHQDHEFVIRLSHSARLYPGLLDAPVALRGVHAENRITRNEQQARTQVVMYDHLWAWSRKQALPVAVQQRFRDQLLAYRIRAAAEEHKPFQALGVLVRHPRQLKRPDSVGLCIDAFTSPGGKTNRALHNLSDRTFALLWKIKGGERPGRG